MLSFSEATSLAEVFEKYVSMNLIEAESHVNNPFVAIKNSKEVFNEGKHISAKVQFTESLKDHKVSRFL